MTRRLSPIRKKLQALADAPGVIDPVYINVWTERDGEPVSERGRQVEIRYRRADGGKRFKAQTGDAWK